MKKMLVLFLLLIGLGAGGVYYWRATANPPTSFRTVPVKRGELLATISATGTLEPEEVIDIGAQVQGQIDSFGIDPRDRTLPVFGASTTGLMGVPLGSGPYLAASVLYAGRSTPKLVDYGTPVEKGTILAHIDDALYASDVENAAAQLEQARANVQRAEADLLQMKAKLFQADRDWVRAKRLHPGQVIADIDYDTAQATYETTKSSLAVGEATIVQAKKAVLQAEAALKKAKKNLDYCTIRSPVRGVIVDRRVNIGQTVVSSLNAPSLFLIATDLTHMQIWASVNEADIGQIHKGQMVTFTVDAYPGQVFHGEVNKIRLNATMTQNVVTYTVEINTDNANGKLLPYQTANIQFEVSKQSNALLVPNSALRWQPRADRVHPDDRAAFITSQRRKETGPGAPPPTAAEKESHDRGTLWVKDGDFVRPVKVRIGPTDGTMTEILGGEITEGSDIVVGEGHADTENGTTNPFAPQMFQKK
jgi:HlyD family secretion protein